MSCHCLSEAASRDVRNLRQHRQIPSRTRLRISLSASRRRRRCVAPIIHSIYLRDTSTCDYLLAMRSCRGRGGPSKRVSNIHVSVQTHPSLVARNMRSRGNMKMRRTCVTATCATWGEHACIYVIDEHVRESTGNLEFHLHS